MKKVVEYAIEKLADDKTISIYKRVTEGDYIEAEKIGECQTFADAEIAVNALNKMRDAELQSKDVTNQLLVILEKIRLCAEEVEKHMNYIRKEEWN